MDDDLSILESVKKLLEYEGYNVDTAETGKEAKDKISSHCYDLTILDMKLPDSDGTELLKEVNKESPDTVKIILTGYPTLNNAVNSLNIGSDAFIIKPINPQKLLSIVKENLRKHERDREMTLERVKKWIMQQVNNSTPGLIEHENREGEAKDLIKILDSYNKLLGESNSKLKQSNAELENYTYVVSHDLKTPLRAIRSFSTFLLEDYHNKLDETGQEYLKRIENAAANMNELIESLLVLSRVGRKFMEIERINLNMLLDEIITDLKPVIESRSGKIIVGKLPEINVQRVWIKELFMNLIDNGLKFNKSPVPQVEISCEERAEDYLFRIADNGIGIEEKYLPRIFKLFERLHSNEEYEGTGAGLAICKRIVENFGGQIWVESIFGKGSSFLFTKPKTNKKENRIV